MKKPFKTNSFSEPANAAANLVCTRSTHHTNDYVIYERQEPIEMSFAEYLNNTEISVIFGVFYREKMDFGGGGNEKSDPKAALNVFTTE